MWHYWQKLVDWWNDAAPVIIRAKSNHLTIGPVVDKAGTDASPYRLSHRIRRRSQMSLVLTDEQKVRLKIQPKTKKGNAARVDGDVVWSSSDPSIVQVIPDITDPTGKSAWAVAKGLGVAQVQAAADADLGPGLRSITAVIDIEVKPAEAVSLGIVTEAPVEQDNTGEWPVPTTTTVAPSTPPPTTNPPTTFPPTTSMPGTVPPTTWPPVTTTPWPDWPATTTTPAPV